MKEGHQNSSQGHHRATPCTLPCSNEWMGTGGKPDGQTITCQQSFFGVLFTPLQKQKKLDTQLPLSRAGGQGLYLKSLHYLGRSSEVKDCKNPKVKCDQRTNKAGSRIA